MSTYRIKVEDETTGKSVFSVGGIPERLVVEVMMHVGPRLAILRLAGETKKSVGNVVDAIRRLIDAAKR